MHLSPQHLTPPHAKVVNTALLPTQVYFYVVLMFVYADVLSHTEIVRSSSVTLSEDFTQIEGTVPILLFYA